MNISSLVVIPHPEHIESVKLRLTEIDGVEVHSVSPEGKTIVTIEAPDDPATIRIYETISQMEGVMSASMVFHQIEPNPETEISVEA